jgi:outer membrane protein OmpA-like peptidoglycan-associated protein
MPTEDANLGFQPSHAPPLDPSISQYVPSSVIARYQRTASLSGTPGVAAPARTAPRVNTAMAYPGQSSGAPMAVVTFAQSGTALSADAQAQVRAAVQAFRAAGGHGYVRVVGHAASLGPTSQEQLSRSFEESQACANAVAQALIKQGVPANKVLVEAVGASNGESGARRAEIFLQG